MILPVRGSGCPILRALKGGAFGSSIVAWGPGALTQSGPKVKSPTVPNTGTMGHPTNQLQRLGRPPSRNSYYKAWATRPWATRPWATRPIQKHTIPIRPIPLRTGGAQRGYFPENHLSARYQSQPTPPTMQPQFIHRGGTFSALWILLGRCRSSINNRLHANSNIGVPAFHHRYI